MTKGFALLFGVSLVAGYNLPEVMGTALERDFLAVRELSYADGSVTFERAIVPPFADVRDGSYSIWADWSVHVYPMGGAAICNGTGSSEYSVAEPAVKTMALDRFVGQPGCLPHLSPGEYRGVATWTPRDGRDTITATFPIVID